MHISSSVLLALAVIGSCTPIVSSEVNDRRDIAIIREASPNAAMPNKNNSTAGGQSHANTSSNNKNGGAGGNIIYENKHNPGGTSITKNKGPTPGHGSPATANGQPLTISNNSGTTKGTVRPGETGQIENIGKTSGTGGKKGEGAGETAGGNRTARNPNGSTGKSSGSSSGGGGSTSSDVSSGSSSKSGAGTEPGGGSGKSSRSNTGTISRHGSKSGPFRTTSSGQSATSPASVPIPRRAIFIDKAGQPLDKQSLEIAKHAVAKAVMKAEKNAERNNTKVGGSKGTQHYVVVL